MFVGVMSASTVALDAVPVVAAALPTPLGMPAIDTTPSVVLSARDATFATRTGLLYRLDFASGRVDLQYAGSSTLHRSQASGLLVRGVKYDTAFTTMGGWAVVSSNATGVTLVSHSTSLGVHAQMTLTAVSGGIDSLVTLTDTSGAERALSVYFAVPLNARTLLSLQFYRLQVVMC